MNSKSIWVITLVFLLFGINPRASAIDQKPVLSHVQSFDIADKVQCIDEQTCTLGVDSSPGSNLSDPQLLEADASMKATLAWLTRLGRIDYDGDHDGYGVAVDKNGYVYMTGRSTSSWGTPIRPFTEPLYYKQADAVIAKLASDGKLIWHAFLGGSSEDSAGGIVVDGSGYTYVAGVSCEDWGNPIQNNHGECDAFVVKLDGNGSIVWHTFIGGSDFDGGWGIALSSDGGVYVSGQSEGAWGVPLRAYSGKGDVFVARLDRNGRLEWNTFLGGVENEGDAPELALDGEDNVYVCGENYGSNPNTSWGSPIFPFKGSDGFVAKLDKNGALLWNTFLGSPSYDDCHGLDVDDSGGIFVTGPSGASWGQPIRSFTPRGKSSDAFVAKLDSKGQVLWNTFLGGETDSSSYVSSDDWGSDVAVDQYGRVYVAGSSNSSWGSPQWPKETTQSGFVAQLDKSGALQWNTFMDSSFNGTSYVKYPKAISTDHSGNIVLTGSVQYVAKLNMGAPQQYTPTVELVSSLNPAPPRKDVSFTGTVKNGQNVTGKMSFLVNNSVVANCTDLPLQNASATCTISSLEDGTHVILARYSGDAQNNPAESTLTQVIEGSSQITSFTLTVDNKNPVGGTVKSAPTGIDCGVSCVNAFNSGTQVTLEAIPGSGYRFDGWQGACNGTNQCLVQITQDLGVTANFSLLPPTYPEPHANLAVSITRGKGTISSDPTGLQCGSSCDYKFTKNTKITLTATPEEGYRFKSWSGACTGKKPVCVLKLKGNRKVKASFR